MDHFSSEEENTNRNANVCNGGNYKRFSLSDSRMNSMSSLFLSSYDDGELITDIKEPSLSSVNMTDSLISNSTLSSNFNTCKEVEDTQGMIISNDSKYCNGDVNYERPENKVSLSSGTVCSVNETLLTQSNDTLKRFFHTDYKEDFSSDMDVISNRKYYSSTPLCANKKFTSISLQDVSIIDLFPLETNATSAFSTETIPTQSISSTIKSKDSGFQRSASCLSLNSGNRSYEHVQSKVKQYIKGIKDSEAKRKKGKPNISNELNNNNLSGIKNVIVNVLATSTDEKDNECITQLKHELKEKDTILNELQQNYNTLLGKYAEAVNKIDVLRLRSSLNNDFYLDRSNDAFACRNWSSLFSDHTSYTHINKTSNNTIWNQNSNNNPSFQNIVTDLETSEAVVNYNNCNKEVSHNEVVKDVPSRIENINFHQSHVNNTSYSIDGFDGEYKWKDETLKPASLSELQQPLSSSQSTSLVSSLKSTTLRPISRMYSSSSRLDKKMSPLPTSSSSAVAFLSNKRKRKPYLKNPVESYDPKSNDANVQSSNERINNKLNNRDLFSSSALVDNENNSKVPYVACFDPFEKIRKWQRDSFPTTLMRSPSNSSVESTENLVSETKKVRSNSLGSKLDEDNFNNCTFSNLSKVRAKESKGIDLFDKSRGSICKSEQNVLTKWSGCNIKNGTNSIRKSKRNVFKRSDAFERNSEELRENHCNVDFKNGNKIIDRHLVIDMKENGGDGGSHSAMDESTSMSSAILSSEEDELLHKTVQETLNFEKLSLANKNILLNSSEILNNSPVICKMTSKNENTEEKSNVGFVSKTQYEKKFKEYVPQENRGQKMYAWETPKRDIFTLKNQSNVVNKESCQPSNENKLTKSESGLIIRKRKQKLKRFTEILSGKSLLDGFSKSFVDVGTQISDDECMGKLHSSSSLCSLSTCSRTCDQNLKEADAYIKYVIEKVKQIGLHLDELQISHTSFSQTVHGSDSS